MSNVIANMSMSLDGFIEDRDGGVGELFRWYESGSTTTTMPGDDRVFKTSKESAELLREAVAATGAIVCGRTLFDLTKGWGGNHPTGAPVVVVTHDPPGEWPHPNATFVTTGVEDAIELATEIAAGKTVAVASGDIACQCLERGLLDALNVDLVPILLGDGKPFFASLEANVWLDDPVVTAGEGVTHMHYRVRRGEG